MRWLAIVIIVSSWSTSAAFAQKPKYKQLKPGGVEYSVEMPGEPGEITVTIPFGEVAVQVSGWDLVFDQVRYQVITIFKHSENSPSFRRSLDLLIEGLQRTFVQNHVSMFSEREIGSEGHRVVQYQLKIGEHSGVVRFYEGKQGFYAALVVGALEGEPIRRFFDSFRLGEWRQPRFEESRAKGAQSGLPPDPWQDLNFSAVNILELGVLNGKAIEFPSPGYPKKAKGGGRVVVRVVVDERGMVFEAEAASGPTDVQEEAIAAARKARFKPVSIGGRPVRVSGVLTYFFVGR